MPIVKWHRERGRNQLELLTQGYLKYAVVDDSGRLLILWRRRTQRAVVRARS